MYDDLQGRLVTNNKVQWLVVTRQKKKSLDFTSTGCVIKEPDHTAEMSMKHGAGKASDPRRWMLVLIVGRVRKIK